MDNYNNAVAAVPEAWRAMGTGDFNGDGRGDILWRHDNGEVANWLGTASGGFADNYLNSIAEVPTDWQIEGVGDFNGDGRADVLWRHESGALTNWLATEAGGFNANNSLMAQVPSDWRVLGTGDFDGDGMSDVLWRHEDGSLTNWLGQADGGFVASSLYAQVPTDWHVVAFLGDYNGDGYDDDALASRHRGGDKLVWRGNERLHSQQ